MMKSPGSGKKVMHSKASPMGQGSVRMPPAQPTARFNVPKDHTCKVCPGSARKR
jgi:hypothetical protein